MSTKLIQSYVEDRFFVSTIHRESSAALAYGAMYYETMAWTWDKETRTRGQLLLQEDSGLGPNVAMESHARICAELRKRTSEGE